MEPALAQTDLFQNFWPNLGGSASDSRSQNLAKFAMVSLVNYDLSDGDSSDGAFLQEQAEEAEEEERQMEEDNEFELALMEEEERLREQAPTLGWPASGATDDSAACSRTSDGFATEGEPFFMRRVSEATSHSRW